MFLQLHLDVFGHMKRDVDYNKAVESFIRVDERDYDRLLPKDDPLWEYKSSFGRLCLRKVNGQDMLFKDQTRIVVSGNVRNALRRTLHKNHFGTVRQYKRVKKRFYWPGMKMHFYQMTENCDACQRLNAFGLDDYVYV